MSNAPIINYHNLPRKRSGNRISAFIFLLILGLCASGLTIFAGFITELASSGAGPDAIRALIALVAGLFLLTVAHIWCAVGVIRGGRISAILAFGLAAMQFITEVALLVVLVYLASMIDHHDGLEEPVGLYLIFSVTAVHMSLLAITLYLLFHVIREPRTSTA